MGISALQPRPKFPLSSCAWLTRRALPGAQFSVDALVVSGAALHVVQPLVGGRWRRRRRFTPPVVTWRTGHLISGQLPASGGRPGGWRWGEAVVWPCWQHSVARDRASHGSTVRTSCRHPADSRRQPGSGSAASGDADLRFDLELCDFIRNHS